MTEWCAVGGGCAVRHSGLSGVLLLSGGPCHARCVAMMTMTKEWMDTAVQNEILELAVSYASY